MVVYRPKSRRRTSRAVVPGYTRTSGFYGRFSGQKGGELKFHDVDLDDAVIAAAGTVTPSINLIAQGVTESTRVGRKCTLKRIGWKYTIELPEADAVATPNASDLTRIIMFLDKQCNGATAAVTDILETADFQSFNNLANSGRFRILMDKVVTLNHMTLASDGAGLVSSSNRLASGSFYKTCNIPLEFSATTGAITEIRSNNVGVLLLARQTGLVFTSKIRLRFSDGS